MIWPLVALLAIGGGPDPRIEIVSAQLSGDVRAALTLTDQLLASQPEEAQELGFDYLRGDLLERLGRRREADSAFAQAMSRSPTLAAYGRYRLALNQSRSGHPEVAAGLLATLIATMPSQPLTDMSARLLADALSRGGDCRLLSKMDSWSLAGEARRFIELSAVDCSLAVEPGATSVSRLLRLLEENIVDEPARLAALRLHRSFSSDLTRRPDLLLVGRVFHHQRQFELALIYLERGLAAPRPNSEEIETDTDARYAIARSHFWLGNYLDAVREFGRVAQTARRPETAAGALYQQGRSYELHGSVDAAAASYRQSYLEDSEGRWAAPALLSTMRVEWLQGREQEALAVYDVLGSRRGWRALHGRAALFLASSDVVRGTVDRAETWIEQARSSDRSLRNPSMYWRGRLQELRGNNRDAVTDYLELIASDPFHPFALLARHRIESTALAATAKDMAAGMATRSDTNSLFKASILLGQEPAGQDSLGRVRDHYLRLGAAQPFVRLEFVAPENWPLWDAPMQAPEDILLSFGLWKEGERAASKHFPASNVSLAYTGSRLLARGGAHRAALRRAETLHQAALLRIPAPLIPVPLRRAVFPLPFGSEIAAAAARHAVDPYLLTALIREESRFDTHAVSSASARGLTQFVLTTARRIAPRAGLESVTAEDLHRPQVAIALGAAYLEELLERYDDREFQAIAAYNAGEAQAELWLRYCFGTDPAEYLTKVGFPETRRYLEKVLESRAQYLDLYAPETFANPR